MVNKGQEAIITFEPALAPLDQIIKGLKPVTKPPVIPPITDPVKAAPPSIIFNIETLGLKPWEKRIITIGFQDAKDTTGNPTIIMLDDEKAMIEQFFRYLSKNEMSRIIGYNLSFDFRFIILRAMYHNIPFKEFYDLNLFDLYEIMSKGKDMYMFKTQYGPNLSDISDFYFGYPKAFTDLEMMEYYKKGQLDKVLEFADAQIRRTHALYILYKTLAGTQFSLGVVDNPGNLTDITKSDTLSLLPQYTVSTAPSIPGNPIKCPNCLAEFQSSSEIVGGICPICKNPL